MLYYHYEGFWRFLNVNALQTLTKKILSHTWKSLYFAKKTIQLISCNSRGPPKMFLLCYHTFYTWSPKSSWGGKFPPPPQTSNETKYRDFSWREMKFHFWRTKEENFLPNPLLVLSPYCEIPTWISTRRGGSQAPFSKIQKTRGGGVAREGG